MHLGLCRATDERRMIELSSSVAQLRSSPARGNSYNDMRRVRKNVEVEKVAAQPRESLVFICLGSHHVERAEAGITRIRCTFAGFHLLLHLLSYVVFFSDPSLSLTPSGSN